MKLKRVLLAVRVESANAYIFRRLAGYEGRRLGDYLEDIIMDYVEKKRREGSIDKTIWDKWNRDYREFLGT